MRGDKPDVCRTSLSSSTERVGQVFYVVLLAEKGPPHHIIQLAPGAISVWSVKANIDLAHCGLLRPNQKTLEYFLFFVAIISVLSWKSPSQTS